MSLGRSRGAVTDPQHYGGDSQSPRLSLSSRRQGQPPKKLPETDLIFNYLQAQDQQAIEHNAVRLSLDFRVTVYLGDYSRGGPTQGVIVDVLEYWIVPLTPSTQQALPSIQLKVDNGPESNGVRTQFLNRLVPWVGRICNPLQLLYFLPYHSKYNPIERCWGILEQHLEWSLSD